MLGIIVAYGMQFTAGFFFLQSVLCCLPLRSEKYWLRLLAWIGYTAVATITVFPQDAVNITVLLCVFLLLNFVLCKGKWLVKIAVVLIFFPMAMAVQFLYLDVCGRIFFHYYTVADQLENEIFSDLGFLLVIAFWWAVYRNLKGSLAKMRQRLNDRAWIMISVICLASFAAIFSCTYYAPDESYKVWPCVLACCATNIGSIVLAAYLGDGIFADMERRNLQLQKSYYEELERNQKEIRRLRHDMNHHLSVVGQLLREGADQEAAAYFDKITDAMKAGNRRFCRNDVVNAVLNAKYNLMIEEGIDTFFHVGIDDMLHVDDISLCTIFANTLDNAIEACRKMEPDQERRISMKARSTDQGYFSYEIVNTKQNPVKTGQGLYLTDKADAKLHGIGLSSVKEVVDRYGGTMDISYTEDRFCVTILIG